MLIPKSIVKNGPLVLIVGSVSILFIVAAVYFVQLRARSSDLCPRAEQAVFDFSTIDFNDQKSVPLRGDVAFYWNQLLTPDLLADTFKTGFPDLMTIPSSWNAFEYQGKAVGAKGYATYHFQIKVSSPGMYSLKVKEFETAFKIWVDGVHLGGAGVVGKSKADAVPSWERQEFEFYSSSGVIDVVLQVSNFHHRNGGVGELMVFGSSRSIGIIKIVRASTEALLLGVLLILFLFNITFYHYQRKNKSLLYFALTVLFVFLRLSTSGEKLFIELFPFLPWSITTRVEYLALVGIAPFLTVFFKSMLPHDVPKWLVKFVVIVYAFLALLILCTPAVVFTHITIFNIVVSFFVIVAFFVVMLKARLKKAEHSRYLFIAYIFLGLIMINDLLYYVNVIQSVYLLPFGLIILLVTQAFLLARSTSIAFAKVEVLSAELERYNAELEHLVAQRTERLQEQTNRVELQKNKIEEQAIALEKSNKRLIKLDNYRKDMTHMMVHDLKNPLTNVIGFLQLPTIDEKRKQIMLASSIDLQNLIQNILDVAKYQNIELSAHLERFLLRDLVEAAYLQNEYAINVKSITFENMVSERISVFVDGGLITRVLSNIIVNATKYKNDNGLIRVSVEEIEHDGRIYDKVVIYNSGESIPEDKLAGVFDIYSQVYASRGEYSYSTGIGLAFCKLAIGAHNGEIGVESHSPKGVSFWFTLPYPV